METLYDLLGALPRDEAEDLRAAFRRAVKGTHPDIRPGDPEAALKFRQIVRANEILTDPEQRAAYDHLVALAQQEKERAAARPVAVRVHRLASGVMTFAGASIVAVASYLLSTALVATAHRNDTAAPTSQAVAAASKEDSARSVVEKTSIARSEATAPPLAPDTPSLSSAYSEFPVLSLGALPDPTPNYAKFFHARGIAAYRNGDFNGAIADLDQAIQLDPKLSVSYIDRGVAFYRFQKSDRGFAEIAPTRRSEKQSHAKSTASPPGKPHVAQLSPAPPATPQPPRRPPIVEPPHPAWFSYRQESPAAITFN
jgi:tetratricopeptide (TPR) repeat protein